MRFFGSLVRYKLLNPIYFCDLTKKLVAQARQTQEQTHDFYPWVILSGLL